MEQKQLSVPHNIIIEDRKNVSISGVTDVESFDEETVVLMTDLGELIIKGFGLHISKIDVVSGDLALEGEIYNIGGGSERTNLEVVRLILAALGKPESLIAYVKDRPGHDWRYALDCGKITAQLGGAPVYSFEEGIVETIRWYLDHPGRGEISSPLV